MNRERLKVLYFGVYDPDYSRNRVLISGLRKNGIEVVECCISAKENLKPLKLFFKYLRLKSGCRTIIVGFPGQEIMFLARLISRKPIIFDAFTSHYGGYILDRRYFSPKSPRAKYYRFLDKWSCRLADVVLLDTQAHIDFFVKEYKISPEKFRRIFVGTDSNVFKPTNGGNKPFSERFIVHFHGNYIPLQGVLYVIKAAKILEGENIFFNLIGNGQTYKSDRKLAEDIGVKNINFIEPVGYEILPDYIEQAEVCLGIFGDSPKTELVIPNKIYEALAMAKPVITSETTAVKELLTDREDVLFCKKADPKDLADKILELKKKPELRRKIAESGYGLSRTKLDVRIIGEELLSIVKTIKK